MEKRTLDYVVLNSPIDIVRNFLFAYSNALENDFMSCICSHTPIGSCHRPRVGMK